jgi:RimJ/RimL family protein N-acetyltransferase
MRHPYWPLFGLRVETPRLELCYPDDDMLPELLAAADAGIHDSDDSPFNINWTTGPEPERGRRSLQHWWRERAEWGPESWRLTMAVVADGRILGAQDLTATEFPRRKSVQTGSWLTRSAQGRGLGKEMRTAILHLAFDGLGALEAHSRAFTMNPASIAVSRAVGYEDNGESIDLRGDVPDCSLHFRLSRERWDERRRDDILVVGLAACLPMFGLS